MANVLKTTDALNYMGKVMEGAPGVKKDGKPFQRWRMQFMPSQGLQPLTFFTFTPTKDGCKSVRAEDLVEGQAYKIVYSEYTNPTYPDSPSKTAQFFHLATAQQLAAAIPATGQAQQVPLPAQAVPAPTQPVATPVPVLTDPVEVLANQIAEAYKKIFQDGERSELHFVGSICKNLNNQHPNTPLHKAITIATQKWAGLK